MKGALKEVIHVDHEDDGDRSWNTGSMSSPAERNSRANMTTVRRCGKNTWSWDVIGILNGLRVTNDINTTHCHCVILVTATF